MLWLILGLALFLGVHSVRIVADEWRSRQLTALGMSAWKGIYALLSVVGFALICYGYGQSRHAPVVLWTPPLALRHATALLMLVSLVLLAAAYVPRNRIKAHLGHPMVAGVKVWAFAHLLSNGNLGDVVLFGAFLVWAILSFLAARRRDRVQGVAHPGGTPGGTATAVGAGAVAWVALAFWLHAPLIGVRPFG